MKIQALMFWGILTIIVVLLALSGCGSEITSNELDPSEDGVQEGYVVEVSDSSILVVSDLTQEQAVDLSQEDILEGIGRNAVWYEVEDIASYKVGQLIRVQSNAMRESYPAQSEAIRVQIVGNPPS